MLLSKIFSIQIFIFFFFNSNHHKTLFFNARALRLGYFDIFSMPFPFLTIYGIVHVIAHNFMKSGSCDGPAAKGLL